MAPADNTEDELEQTEIVSEVLGPADQNSAEAVEPGLSGISCATGRLNRSGHG